jgi:hypothetical protein
MSPLIEQLRQRIKDPRQAVESMLSDAAPVPAPVAETQLRDAEKLLGFTLPESLRSLYAHVGNGDFGPGYGLLPVPLGAPGLVDLVGVFWYVRGDARRPDPGAFFDPGKASLEMGDCEGWSVEGAEVNVNWRWPDMLLPIISHGCGIYECLDCSRPDGAVILHHPDFLRDGGSVQETLTELASSLSVRFEAWLRHDDLFKRAVAAYPVRH